MKGIYMKSNRILSAAAALAMAVSLCGCSVKVGTNKVPKDTAVIAEARGEAAQGKNLDITYGDFRKEYLYFLNAAGITDDSDEDYAETCKTQRETIVNYLINEKIILDKAQEMGLSQLTSEEMDAVEEEYNKQLQEQFEYFGSKADFGESETGEEISDEQRLKRGEEDYDKYLTDCGLTRDDLLMWQVNALITDKVRTEVTKDTKIDYSEAEDVFAEYISDIKNIYAENSLTYETGEYTMYWLPDGSRNIKHILLGFEDTFTDELLGYREEGDNEKADALRTEKAAEFDEKVTEICNMIDNGADFDELILEYSADVTGSSMYPDGYLVIPDSKTFMQEFVQASFEIEEVGGYTITCTDYGVHIVKYAGDAVVSEEQTKYYIDYIYEQLQANAVDVEFSSRLTEWKTEYDYKIDYETLKIDDPAAQPAE